MLTHVQVCRITSIESILIESIYGKAFSVWFWLIRIWTSSSPLLASDYGLTTQLLMTSQFLKMWSAIDLYIIPKKTWLIKALDFWTESTRVSVYKAQGMVIWHIQSVLPFGRYLVLQKVLWTLSLLSGQSFKPDTSLCKTPILTLRSLMISHHLH